jgi:hypothetical protein
MVYRLHRRGCTIAESPIVFYDRTLGESKLSSREIYVGAFRLILLRLTLGARGGQQGSAQSQPRSAPAPK